MSEKEIPDWQSVVKWGDKLTKTLKVTFIIGDWSEAGGFYMKITQNCQISEPNSADLCTMIFNGIYSVGISISYFLFFHKDGGEKIDWNEIETPNAVYKLIFNPFIKVAKPTGQNHSVTTI